MKYEKFVRSFHISILLLTLITVGAHLYLGMQPDEELRTLFALNALGYLGLVIIFLMPQLKLFHNQIRWIFFGYTLLTIVLWFVITTPWNKGLDQFDGVVKAVEVVLAVHLLLDRMQENLHKT